MKLSRRQICAYVAIAVVVIAVGFRYVVAPRAESASGGQQLVLASASPAASAAGSPSAAADVVVYVCGAVRSPGVVRLPAGARVADALDLAGGATAKAELAAVNLAARVSDGQQILVPERGASGGAACTASTVDASASASGGAGASGGASAAAAGLININTASLAELDQLQGVGPATAQKIIDYREANGGFKTVDDIKNVPGIGDAKFAAMRDSIVV